MTPHSTATDSAYFLNLPPLSARYMWLRGCTLPHRGSGAFVFEARASNDIHVCFHTSCSDDPAQQDSRYPDAAATYEFLFGGYTNTKSLIRKRGRQVAMTSTRFCPSAAVTPHVFARYWVSVTSDGVLSMGQGSLGENLLLRFTDPQPEPDVLHIGVSSWDTPVQLRNFYATGAARKFGAGRGLLGNGGSAVQVSSVVSPDWRFNLYVLQQSGAFCDATLVLADGQRCPVHCAVLAASSPRFASLFSSLSPPSSSSSSRRAFADVTESCDVVEVDVERQLGVSMTLPEWDTCCVALYTGRLCGSCAEDMSRYTDLANRLQLVPIQHALRGPVLPEVSTLHCVLPALQPTLHPDCVLVADNVRLPAHRAVLSAHSNFFFRMFLADFRESLSRQCDLTGLASPRILEILWRLAYADSEIIHNNSNVFGKSSGAALDEVLQRLANEGEDAYGAVLLCAASELMMATVKGDVEKAVVRRLKSTRDDAEAAVQIVAVACAIGCTSLHAKCVDLMAHFFSQLPPSVLEHVSPEVMIEVLMRDEAHSDEAHVLRVLVHWHRTQPEVATEELLLSMLRLHLLSDEFVMMLLNMDKDVQAVASTRVVLTPLLRKRLQETIGSCVSSINDDDTSVVDLDAASSPSPVSIHGTPNSVLPASRVKRCVTYLAYAQPGDTNGVFFFLGSGGHSHDWVNPHECGMVRVTTSSPRNRFSRADHVIDRRAHSTVFFTCPTHEPWVAVDLGDQCRLRCTAYSFRHDASASEYLRSWDLEASSDGVEWTVLRQHRNDASVSHARAIVCFQLPRNQEPDEHDPGHRMFRLMMRGPSSSGTDHMVVCALELYGYLHQMVAGVV